MRITKRQLLQIIREEAKSTKKYDDDSALKGDQDELPDALQKGIIDKTVEDREKKEAHHESIKRTIKRVLKEEGSDCAKDYRNGTLTYQEYLDCLKRYGDDDDDYRPRYQRKTSYVGRDANADQIAAIEAALAVKPNNFLTSILSQLKRGRGLSSKQKSIVRRILNKTDPTAVVLFEIKKKIKRLVKEQVELIDLEDIIPAALEDADPEFIEAWQEVDEESGRKMGDGGSAEMARGQLFTISQASQSLHDRLRDQDELPEWVQSKIAQMADDMDSVEDYLSYKIHRQEN